MNHHKQLKDADAPYKIGERVKVSIAGRRFEDRGTVVQCIYRPGVVKFLVRVKLDTGSHQWFWAYEHSLIRHMSPLELLADAA